MNLLQCSIRTDEKSTEGSTGTEQKEGVTVILITHYMEEVVFADDVYVMDRGQIVMHGVPREIFSRVDQLKKYRLDVPQVTLLAYELKEAGLAIPDGILTIPELVEALSKPQIHVPEGWKLPEATAQKEEKELLQGKESLKLEHVGYTYNPGSAYEMHALKMSIWRFRRDSSWESSDIPEVENPH